MAIFDGKFIKGTAGAVIYKQYRGQQVIQGKSKKKTTKRTAATKKAAATFGTASNLAGTFRGAMGLIISSFYDGTMIFRLNTEVLYSLRQALDAVTKKYQFTEDSFSRLNGFEFNLASPVKNMFFARPEISINTGILTVKLPEMDIPKDLKYAKDTRTCKLNISLTMYDLTYGHVSKAPIKTLEISYDHVHPIIVDPTQWDFEIEPGCLCIVAISLQYIERTFSGDALVNNKAFNPAAIIKAVIAEGTVNEEQTKNWAEIQFKLN